MKKIKKKKNKKRKGDNKSGGRILFTVSLACLIALVGLVYMIIAQQIGVFVESENNNIQQISQLKEEKDKQLVHNEQLFSSENILNLLRKFEVFDRPFSISSAKDTIKVRF